MNSQIIVFDLSEVLIRGLVGIHERLAGAVNLADPEILRLLGGPNLHRLCRGEMCESDYLAAVTQANSSVPVEQWRKAIRNNFAMFVPGVREIAERLRQTHRVVLLSDHGREWVEHILEIHPWLAAWPERFFSFDHGRLKRDKDTFTWLSEQLGAGPEQCLLIDDLWMNVECAMASGWDAIQFENAEQLAKELARRGIMRSSRGLSE